MDPRNENGQDTDDLRLEQDLRALHAAAAEVEPREPPELLDAAVLNTARRALSGRPRSRSVRWFGAFATAAVVILALSLVLQQHSRPPEEADSLRLEPARKAVDTLNIESAAQRSIPVEGQDSDAATGFRLESAPMPSPTAAAPALSAEAEADEKPLEKKNVRDARSWVERLLMLFREQRFEELETELAAFRQAYPDYPLPPELKD